MDENTTNTPTAAFIKSPFANNLKDETGKRFGRLVVLRREGRNISEQVTWRCLCDCGNETIQAGSTLRAGTVVSCGCYGKEARLASVKTHGLSKTPIYNYYHAMRARMAEEHPGAHNYYGRGIRICERWTDAFQNFIDDMLPKLEEANRLLPGKVLTLERRDVNGPYCKENCYFATMKVQCNNKRNNVRYVHAGEDMTSTQWAERAGLSLPAFRARIILGWTMEEILNTPVQKGHSKSKYQVT